MADNNDRSSATRRDYIKYAGAASAAAMTGLAGCSGGGDGEYPNDDITYIIPFSEGGGTDTYARQFISHMGDELDTNIAIENVPGAASLRGTGQLYNADADGYAIGGFNPPSTPVSAMVNPPEFEMTDLEGVGTYARTPFVVVANPEYEMEGFEDMVSRYANDELEIFAGKERGGVDHVLALLMQGNDSYDIQWDRYVGYDGSGPAVQAVISDEVPASISTDTAAAGAAEDGRIDVLACLSSQGSEVFPDVPSTTELGYDNIDFLGQLVRGVFAPEGTSDDQIQVLTEALEAALQTDEVQNWSEETGNVVEYGGPESASNAVSDAFEQIPEQVDLEAVREAADQ